VVVEDSTETDGKADEEDTSAGEEKICGITYKVSQRQSVSHCYFFSPHYPLVSRG
jgi:hypothetical protein